MARSDTSFIQTRSAILIPSSRQGLSSYHLHQVYHIIPLTRQGLSYLFTLTWSAISSLYPDKVFTLTMSVIWSPNDPDEVCHLIPFTLTKFDVSSLCPDKVCSHFISSPWQCHILLLWAGPSSYPLHPDMVTLSLYANRVCCVPSRPDKVCHTHLLHPDKVRHLILSPWQGPSYYPFTMTRSAALFLSSWQGPSFYPFTLTWSAALSSSSWQGPSYYPFTLTRSAAPTPSSRQGPSSYPFTLTRSAVLFPSPWQNLLFYPPHPDKVCHQTLHGLPP